MPVDGGPETLVLPLVSPGYWSVTEKGIFFVDLSGPPGISVAFPVRFYDFATRRLKQVAILEKPLPFSDMGFSVTRDGHRMVWAQIDQQSADIMLMQDRKP